MTTTARLYTTSINPTTGQPISEGWLPAGAEVIATEWVDSDDPEGRSVLLTIKQGEYTYPERADADAAGEAGIARPDADAEAPRRRGGRPRVGSRRIAVRVPEWVDALAESRGESVSATVRAALVALRAEGVEA
jgi:hypothetical protein